MKKDEEIVQDAKDFVVSYVTRNLKSAGITWIPNVLSIKLGHTPTHLGDDPRDAVIVARDTKTGYIHLYVMTSLFHKEVVEKMFDIKFDDYVGHLVIKTQEESDKLFPIVKDFENVLKSRLEEESRKKKELFPEWNNL